MPWQHHVAAVANEIDPATGEWAYPTVVIIVQRQAGKTSLVGSTAVHRGLTGQDRGVWYTAQSRQDARDNWQALVKRLRRSPLKGHIKVRESNGSESVTLPTGSEYRVFAPGEDALHGKPLDFVMVDEGWSFDEVRGDELIQAIVPGFTTVPGQLVILSAAGTARSTWLMGLRDTGRMFVDSGRRDGIAYFEWGIGDEVDPLDLGAVALAHPGYGYTLRPSGLIAAAGTMKAGEFARAYGSRWTGAAERVIPELLWLSGADATAPLPEAGRFAAAFEVGLEGADAAVAIAWRDDAGRAHVELVDVRDGSSWIPGRVLMLNADSRPLAIGFDRFGPSAAAGDTIARLAKEDPNGWMGLELTSTTTDEYVVACDTFLSGLVAGTVKYRPHPALDAAAAAATKRTVGDRWAWGRRSATATVAPIVACTVALWTLDHAPVSPGEFHVL